MVFWEVLCFTLEITNYYGEKDWINDDPLKPNEKYFKNADLIK